MKLSCKYFKKYCFQAILIGFQSLITCSYLYCQYQTHTAPTAQSKLFADKAFVMISQAIDSLPSSITTSRYMVISKHACASCFDKIVQEVTSADAHKRAQVGIVVLGQDALFHQTQAIMHRRRVHFIPLSVHLYKQLETINKDEILNFMIVLKRATKNRYTYETLHSKVDNSLDKLIAHLLN